MDSNELIFTKLENKRLRYNLLADILLILGGILMFRQPPMSFIISITWSRFNYYRNRIYFLSFRVRTSKQYHDLSLLVKNEPSSFKEVVNLFGAKVNGISFVGGNRSDSISNLLFSFT